MGYHWATFVCSPLVAHNQLSRIHQSLWLIYLTHFLASEMKVKLEIINTILYGGGEGDKFDPRQFFGYSSKMVGARLRKLCDFRVSLLHIFDILFFSRVLCCCHGKSCILTRV